MKLNQRFTLLGLGLIGLLTLPSAFADQRFIQIEARTKEQRSQIADRGVSIEAVRSDSVWGFANENSINELNQGGFKILGNFDQEVARGGHETMFDFPTEDTRFHNYNELMEELNHLAQEHADIVKIHNIGTTVEKRNIWAIHINTSQDELEKGQSNKPGIIYVGNHHAREHLSMEIPLMYAQYLMSHRRDPRISSLLDSRDIWIVPMLNPDGVEFDIATANYKMWRKNRRKNANGTYGVDLNRNYGFGWGTGGSSKDPSSDVYMGTSAFSEPETQAFRDFVNAHANTKVLLSFHTFSELILYPWGGKHDPVPNNEDRLTFETLAKTMAQWNHYTPEQASDLYIASGDTTDWAYGTHGIFAFTFELSPKSMYEGGFYPGQKVIDKVFEDNLKPCLYLLDVTDNPKKVLGNSSSSFLKNYQEPSINPALFW